jgi:hypothetical protein
LITVLDRSYNNFSSFALDALFETLHSNYIEDGKNINIYNNPGMKPVNGKIAYSRGWPVLCFE